MCQCFALNQFPALQHPCNILATSLQPACNIVAASLQPPCRLLADSRLLAASVQQSCDFLALALAVALAPDRVPAKHLERKSEATLSVASFFGRSVCQCVTLAQFPAKHPCSILAAFLQPPCSIQNIYILLSCYYLFSFSTAHCHHQERAHFMQNGKNQRMRII